MSSAAVTPEIVRALRARADELEALARVSDGRDLRPGETLVGEISTGLSNMIRIVTTRRETEHHSDPSGGFALAIQAFKSQGDGWFRSGPSIVVRSHRVPALARILSRAIEQLETDIASERTHRP